MHTSFLGKDGTFAQVTQLCPGSSAVGACRSTSQRLTSPRRAEAAPDVETPRQMLVRGGGPLGHRDEVGAVIAGQSLPRHRLAGRRRRGRRRRAAGWHDHYPRRHRHGLWASPNWQGVVSTSTEATLWDRPSPVQACRPRPACRPRYRRRGRNFLPSRAQPPASTGTAVTIAAQARHRAHHANPRSARSDPPARDQDAAQITRICTSDTAVT